MKTTPAHGRRNQRAKGRKEIAKMISEVTFPSQSLLFSTMSVIPDTTTTPQLRYLRARYADGQNPTVAALPEPYRRLVIRRLDALLERRGEAVPVERGRAA
jgi:hypothetical protein